MSLSMEKHAVAILEAAELWKRPEAIRSLPSGATGTQFTAITSKVLQCFISESVSLGGSLLGRFWEIIEECDPLLKENVRLLQQAEFIDKEHSVQLLFKGLDQEEVNFDKIFWLATEIFTHLGAAMWSQGRGKSASDTSITVSEEMNLTLDELLRRAEEPGFETRKQKALKALAYKRDGDQCPLTDQLLARPPIIDYYEGVPAETAHIIPIWIHDKRDTLKILAVFAGPSAVEAVLSKLDTIGNIVNMDLVAHKSYEALYWGIEAQKKNGQTIYVYRNVRRTTKSPIGIKRKEGDRIEFGDRENLPGPDPTLCNIQLAVARALTMSGANELLEQLNDEADDSDFPNNFIASEEFANILTAKLLLSGSSLLF